VQTPAIQCCNTSFLQLTENLQATCSSCKKTCIAVVLCLCGLLQYNKIFVLCYCSCIALVRTALICPLITKLTASNPINSLSSVFCFLSFNINLCIHLIILVSFLANCSCVIVNFLAIFIIGIFEEQNADTFSSHQPALLYLRATMLTAQYKPVAALEDLCQLNIINGRLFPAK